MKTIAQCEMPETEINYKAMIKKKLLTKKQCDWIKKGQELSFRVNISLMPEINSSGDYCEKFTIELSYLNYIY